MSNPWKREARTCGGLPATGSSMAEEARDEWRNADYSALRLRHGARTACKRLREERDEARGHYRWMVERAAAQKLDGYRELGARAAAAENERDAARLELRALEWLLFTKCELVTIEDGQIALIDHDDLGDDGVFESYAAAARALGWEG